MRICSVLTPKREDREPDGVKTRCTRMASKYSVISAGWEGRAGVRLEWDVVKVEAGPTGPTAKRRISGGEAHEDVSLRRPPSVLWGQDGAEWGTRMYRSCTPIHIPTGINTGPVSCNPAHRMVSQHKLCVKSEYWSLACLAASTGGVIRQVAW